MSTMTPTIHSTVATTVMQTMSPGGSIARSYYYFDGTTYATLNTPWAAGGRPREYEINFNADAVSTGQNQYLFSGIEGGIRIDMFLQATNARLQVQYLSAEGTQANEVVLSPLIEAVTDYKIEIKKLGGDAVILINGQPGAPFLTIPGMGIQPPISTIGAREDATLNFTGTIWGVNLTDESPIQGDTYNMGNNATYGTLDTPIALTSDDFYIKFNWRREANNGLCYLYSDSTGQSLGAIRLYNNNHASWPDAISLFFGGTRLDFGITADASQSILNGIEYGQDIVVEIIAGDTIQILINGVEPPQSPNNLANPRVPWNIDRIFASYNVLNKVANGTFSDFVIQQASGDTPRGFIPYGPVGSHPDILEAFSATTLSDTGSLTSADNCDFDPAGMLIPAAEAPVWNSYAGLAATGFTIQLEIESGIFSGLIDQGINGWNILRFQSQERFQRRNGSQNFIWALPAGFSAARFRSIDDALGSHVTVTVDFDPAGGGANGRLVMYANALPCADVELTAPMDTSNIFVSAIGTFVANESSPPFRFRNFMVMEGPMSTAIPSAKNIAVIGASFVRQGQYTSGMADNATPPTPEAQDVPMRAGYTSATDATYSALNQFKTRTMFAGLHEQLADKAIPIAGDYIWNFGRGGCTVHDWSGTSDNLLEHRMEAAYGNAPNLPTPSVGTDVINYWISLAGGNDLTYIDDNFSQPEWDANLDLFVASYKAVIDTYMLAYSATQQIVITSVQYSKNQDFYPDALADACNAKLYAELDGYMGIVSVADISDLSSYDYWDGVHPAAEGQQYLARQVAAQLPSMALTGTSTYTYPLTQNADNELLIENTDPGTGAAFNGQWVNPNFEYIVANSIKYQMDEGSGDILHDSLYVPELWTGAVETTGSLTTWDGTTLHMNGTGPTGTLGSTYPVESGETYRVRFDYASGTSSAVYVRVGGGGNAGTLLNPVSGSYDETLTALGTGYLIQILSADGIIDITNFSVEAVSELPTAATLSSDTGWPVDP